jgi:hypothetical protein
MVSSKPGDWIFYRRESLDSAADNNPSRADRIRSKLYEQSGDVLDTLEKNASIGESIFARPPTGQEGLYGAGP